MADTELNVYRASEQFVTAYRKFQDQHRAHMSTIISYCEAHPGHPISLVRSNLTHQISIGGFKDVTPAVPPPDGLSRKRGRGYLIPARGPRGQRWRDEIKALGNFPSVEDLFTAHGFDVFVLGDAGMFTAAVEDCGANRIFVKIGVPFPRPSEHLTPVPLSECYLAREALTSARAAAPSSPRQEG